nr:dihydrolipoyl dehydrogenase [Bacilli bacterium]
HILQETDTIRFDLVPSCVFTFPEVASIGMTEEEAKEKGFDITIGKAYYRANGKAVSMNETDGFIKIIACDERIIGVHIIGYEASVLIHEALPLVNEEIKIACACDYIHAHPTLSEIFASALKELKK